MRPRLGTVLRLALTYALLLASVGLVIVGVALIYPPAGLVLAGVAIFAVVTFDAGNVGRLTWPR